MNKTLKLLGLLLVLTAVILTSSYGCGDTPTLTPTPTPAALDWPMFRYDAQHTGVTASVISLPLTLKWSFQAANVLMSSPAISGDQLFMDSYALRTSNGKELWQFTTAGPVTTSPTVSGGLVLVGTYEMKVLAVSAKTGKKAWEFQTDN